GSGAVLEFSCIGYETQSVPVGSRGVIDVTLQEALSFLQEAVAIGYGTQKKADITSSVQNVKAEDFNKGAVIDAGQLIQGKVAGLQVTVSSGDPTGSSSVMLRGYSSLLGSTAPLVLIDGIPGSLSTVAPEDIETIDVLKDGSATAIYGTRGTNGVIIITTRNAKREMPATVEYSGYVSASSWLNRPDFLSASDLRSLLAGEDNWTGKKWTFSGANDKDYKDSVDWLSEISRTAVSHNHNLSIMGGTKRNTYTANITYNDFQGTIKGTGRTNMRARAQVSQYLLNDKLKLTAEIMANETHGSTGFDPSYVYRQACIQNPTQPIKNDDGTWNERSVYFYDNPVSYIYERYGDRRGRNIRFNGVVEFKPIEELTFKAMYVRKGQSSYNKSYNTHEDVSTTESGYNGYAYIYTSDYIYNQLELTAPWVKDFGRDHHVTAVVGYNYEDNISESSSMTNSNFPTDAYLWNKMQAGAALNDGKNDRKGMSSNKIGYGLTGAFARATYNYADRYLLMASLRVDGSTKFGEGYKIGYFPGVSVGWRANNEEFLKDVRWLNNLKFRAGFGITGIDVNDPYQSLASLNYDGYFYYGGSWIPVLVPVRNDNPNLRWERKYEYNFGVDFAVLDERLSGSIDLYQRDTRDALYNYSVPVPPYQYGSMMANVGHIQNRGVEVLINAVPVRTNGFEWSTSFTYSYNANKLVSLQNDEFQMSSDHFDTGYTGEPIQTTTHRVKEGWPIGNFYGLRSIGLNSAGKWMVQRYNYDESGNVVSWFPDLAENATSSDWQVLGNGVPKMYVNWNNTFHYKGFDLAITMRGAFGFQLLNYQKLFYGNPTIQYNVLRCAFDKLPVVDDYTGQPTGDTTFITDSQRYLSYYVENGDYWKIDNLTLGYTYNFKANKYIKKVRAYATVHNLATITGYSGLDPEIRVSYGGNGYDPGTDDRDKYPTIRSFTFGVNLTF
ncbi:MAG: SusC/RagA family TonB-linked outer membrane protein, partial [Bacteroidales bacterium]|nr:SusC/RagA family TonB-linked outer membrane protein [Bacteroidales bacterium]